MLCTTNKYISVYPSTWSNKITYNVKYSICSTPGAQLWIRNSTIHATIKILYSSIYALTTIDIHGATAPGGQGPHHYRCFTSTFRHTTVGRTPLDEWSARFRELCLTIHNTHKRYDGFEPAIPAIRRPQTHTLDRAATGTDSNNVPISTQSRNPRFRYWPDNCLFSCFLFIARDKF